MVEIVLIVKLPVGGVKGVSPAAAAERAGLMDDKTILEA
jgi:hypothetical protein